MENTVECVDEQEDVEQSGEFQERLLEFLRPLLLTLDAVLDKRLVRTFVRAVLAIIMFRHSSHGLLLSELGSYILSPAHAPAGTKRLSNLLRSKRWTYGVIEQFLWQRGDARVEELKQAGEEALVVWDESVLEKAGSRALEGLCSVRSSVARWLKSIKPGFYSPPGAPIFVPGMQWVGLLVIGLRGAPEVAAMRWWTTRGELASDKRTEEEHLLADCVCRWGRAVLHVWDRGFAGAPWLGIAGSVRISVYEGRTPYGPFAAEGSWNRPQRPGSRGEEARAVPLTPVAGRLCLAGSGWTITPHSSSCAPQRG